MEGSTRMDGHLIAYEVIESPTRHTAVIRATIKASELPAFFSRTLTGVLQAMEAQGTIPGGEPFAFYRGIHNGTVDLEAGFPVVGPFEQSGDVVPGTLPGGKTVAGVHVGPYETLSRTYADMSAWAIAHGMRPTGEMWEVYLTDPEREPNPDRWRTSVFLRVE